MDFSRTSIRPGRPLKSYSKVQSAITLLVRNNRLQLLRRSVKYERYLDLGCGPNIHKNFVNADFNWLPGVDLCWDITGRLPFEDARFEGIFTEHFIEHLSVETAERVLRECRRIMRPGATIRIVTPDAELYLRTYIDRMSGGGGYFPYEENNRIFDIASPILSVNRVFYQDRYSPYGHWFIYDYDFLGKLLDYVGFRDINKKFFMNGKNRDLLNDSQHRSIESLYVEAIA